MNKIIRYISSQLKNPRGFGGRIVSLGQNVINRKMYTKAVALVEVQAEDKILDIGYGNGHLLKKIYKKCSPYLYGVDLSNDAKQMATRRNKKANAAGKLQLQVGDCCNLPYEDEMFAAVTTINTVYFWSDTVKGLSEIRRCLKPGGSFYNVIYTKERLNSMKLTETGYKKFETAELVEFGKKAGFTETKVKEIVKGESCVVVYSK